MASNAQTSRDMKLRQDYIVFFRVTDIKVIVTLPCGMGEPCTQSVKSEQGEVAESQIQMIQLSLREKTRDCLDCDCEGMKIK